MIFKVTRRFFITISDLQLTIQEDHNIHTYSLFCLVVLAAQNSKNPSLLLLTYRNQVFSVFFSKVAPTRHMYVNQIAYLTYSRVNVTCGLMCSRASVPCVLTGSRAYVPTCLACLRNHVFTCLAGLRAHVPTWIACLRAHVL